MSRFIFAAVGCLSIAAACAAQQVPGRDLFEFPVGLLAEAAPLSSQMPGGLWNAASGMLPNGYRGAAGIAVLTSPQDLGVNIDVVAGAVRVRRDLTATLSIASASVSDILKTDTDPTSLGSEIQYGTTLVSAGVASRYRGLTYGFNARYRGGVSDRARSGAFAVDAGVLVDRLAGTPLRLAGSTFLFTPASRDREASYSLAADLPVFRHDSSLVVRLGESIAHTEGRGNEMYTFATAQVYAIDVSTGMWRSSAFGNTGQRWRLGLGLRHAKYTLAFAREQGAIGLDASYQFLLKRMFQ